MDIKKTVSGLKEKPLFKTLIYALAAVLIFAAGFALSDYLKAKKTASGLFTQVRQAGYKFINPLLECEQSEEVFTELKLFKSQIEELANGAQKQGLASHVSVYFRDLNNGPWFGINEKEEFSPASLLKLPVMISYFKLAEENPGYLERELVLKNDGTLPKIVQNIKPGETLEFDKPYKAGDLIQRMITYSDNYSQYALINGIDINEVAKIYSDFNLQLPTAQNPDVQVNVKTYAGFFRMLFNASYLNKNYSEKALEIMTRTEYKNGLVAGVPGNIPVAHKFGEREAAVGQWQLHDCGVVYYPKHPYLLCVMTRGKDINVQAAVIRDMSKRVYEEVDKQYKE